ncbi:MAG TPA: DUF2249 domain-containing protein [Candidatus Methylomirabilis sp.]|nr:DUF2249 domain-containing protein [Candidatus Methylomirabilis sp.]
MAHEESRHHDAPVEPSRPSAPIRLEETVAELVRHGPAAIRILQALGINHCRGAHLTLSEAAASAGVSLDVLVAALDESTAATPGPTVLDVRGLEPPQPLVRVLQAIERLGPDGELEVHHDRRPILLYPQLDERGFVHETDEPQRGLVRIRIRRRGA